MKAWLGAVVFVAAITLYAFWMAQKPHVHTDAINRSLIDIVNAKSVAERETALTASLQWLSEAVNSDDVRMGNGTYYIALGDVYRHFGALPWALWSYSQADKLAPGHPLLEQRMDDVRKSLNLPDKNSSSVFDELLFFHLLSVPRRLQLFTLTAFLAFVFGSLVIWQRNRLWVTSTIVFSSFAALFLLSSFYSRYVEPAEAVLIEATLLSAVPSSNSANVSVEPIPKGAVALVMNIDSDGKWVKVLTEDGQLGYMPAERLRFIF